MNHSSLITKATARPPIHLIVTGVIFLVPVLLAWAGLITRLIAPDNHWLTLFLPSIAIDPASTLMISVVSPSLSALACSVHLRNTTKLKNDPSRVWGALVILFAASSMFGLALYSVFQIYT